MRLSSMERTQDRIVNRLPPWSMPVRAEQGTLSITFDDFPRSAWLAGGPILARFGARATYYLSGGFCGIVQNDVAFYSAQDVTELVAAGHELGCHTFDHHSTFKVDLGTYLASVRRNAAFVETILPGYRLRSHAYPYGHVRASHRRALTPLFDGLRGVRGPRDVARYTPKMLRAAGLEQWQSGRIDWPGLIVDTARRRGWLIAYSHGVTDQPSPFDARPEDLERVLDLAAKEGLRFATVGETLRQLTSGLHSAETSAASSR